MMAHTIDGFHPFGVHAPQKPVFQPHHIHIPPVDIRETDTDYYFDIELPGVTEKDSVNIQWTSSRTLVVDGSIPHITLAEEEQLTGPYDLEQGGGEDDDVPAPPAKAAPQKVRTVVSERRFGKFKRDFSFPLDVDMHSATAVLTGGVLTIKTPKRRSEGFPQKVRVHVE